MNSYFKFKGTHPENDLISAVLSTYTFCETENFPLVRVIGRKERIYPDIDILTIKERNRGEVSAKLIGYETKIIFPDEKGNIKREDFYKGIGEAFFYLEFGLNQCGLILGFHENLSDQKIKEFVDSLDRKKEFLNHAFQSHLGYFNLFIFTGESFLKEIIKAKMDFSSYFYNPPYDNEIKKKIKKFRKLLVEKEFKWNGELAKRCKYATVK